MSSVICLVDVKFIQDNEKLSDQTVIKLQLNNKKTREVLKIPEIMMAVTMKNI
jgi:hypothetical protein